MAETGLQGRDDGGQVLGARVVIGILQGSRAGAMIRRFLQYYEAGLLGREDIKAREVGSPDDNIRQPPISVV